MKGCTGGEDEVQVGDVIFAKMVGYPWWPGVVEEESTLPEDIAEQRPTESEAEADGLDGIDDLFAVRFLGDSSYAWLPRAALVRFHPDHPKLLKKNFKSSRKSSRSLFRVGIEEATTLWEAKQEEEAKVKSETVESSSSSRLPLKMKSAKAKSAASRSNFDRTSPPARNNGESGVREENRKEEIDLLAKENEVLVDEPMSSLKQEEEDSMPLREMAKSYSFRRTRKLSVKAAENGEVPGLRTAKVTRRTSLTEEDFMSPATVPKGKRRREVSSKRLDAESLSLTCNSSAVTDAEGKPRRKTKRRLVEVENPDDDEREAPRTPENFDLSTTTPMKAFSNVDDDFMDFTSKEVTEDLSADRGKDDNVSTSFMGHRNDEEEAEEESGQRGGRGRGRGRGTAKTTMAEGRGTTGLPIEVSEMSWIAPQDGRGGRRFSTEAGVFMEEEVVALSVLVSLKY